MTILERIAAHEARPLIEALIAERAPSSAISEAVVQKYGILFEPADIEKYRQQSMLEEGSPIRQIVKVTGDLAGSELPPTDELSKLSFNFSFQKTNEDLDLLYDRIRKLKVLADANPDDPTFDRRIAEYISKAEAIRTRVFRNQYEQIRQAILLTIGKKICTAAISILFPYIPKDFRPEAMRRFQASIESLLDAKVIPDAPADAIAAAKLNTPL